MKRRLVTGFSLLLAIVLCFAIWLGGSESGLQWVYRQVQPQLPGTLSLDSISGRLAGLVRLEGVAYEDQDQIIKVQKVEVNWNPWALIKAEIDVSSLILESLEVSLNASQDVTDPEKTDATGPRIQFPLALRLRKAEVNGIMFKRGDVAYKLDQVGLSARLGSERLEISRIDVKSPDGAISFKGHVDTSSNLAHDITMTWQTSLPTAPKVSGRGRVTGDLAATLLTQEVLGPLAFNLSLELRNPLDRPTWQATIDASSFDTALLDPGLPALRGAFKLAASGDLSSARAGGHIEAESPELGPFSADFEVRNLDGERKFDGLELESLKVSLLDGEVSATGQLNWQPTLGWKTDITLSAINPGRLFPEWPGNIDATISSTGTTENSELIASAEIERLQGGLRDFPVSMQSSLQWRNNAVEIARLEFTSGETRVNARGRLGEQLDLEWSLDSVNLAELYPGARGQLKANGQLDGPREAPTVSASLNGKSLSLPGYEFGAVTGEVALDLLRWQRFNVNLEARAIKLQDRLLKSVKVVADTRRIQADIVADEVNAQIELNGELDGETWRGRIVKANIQTRDYADWRLGSPADLSLSADSVAAETVCVKNVSNAEICSSVKGKAGEWQIELGLSELALQMLGNWIPPGMQLDGLANANARLEYRLPDQLRGRIEVNLPPASLSYLLRENKSGRFDYRSGKLELLLAETGIQAQTDIILTSGDRVEASARLPGANLLTLDYDNQSLQGEARISARDLGLVGIMLDEVENLKGQLEVNLKIAGTIGEPKIQGSANLIDAQLSAPTLKLELTGFNIKAQSENAEKLVFRADALTADGKISARGNTLLDNNRGWPSELALVFEQLDVSGLIERWLPPQMTVQGLLDGSADLNFRAPDNLTGEIRLSSSTGTLGYPLLEGEQERWEYRDAKLVLLMNSRGIEASSEIQIGNNNSLSGQVNLPQAKLLALDPVSQSIQAKARLDFRELELIEALLPEIEQLQGELALDLSADGTLAQPRLEARAEIVQAALLLPRLGLTIDNISMTGASDNDGKFNFVVNASSGDGNLSIQGYSRLNAADGWPTTINIKGDDFEVSRIPEAAVKISPDLAVKLQHQKIDIEGDLLIPYAKLQPKDITTAARVSDDTIIVGGAEVPEPKWIITTRINVILGERVSFFGFGFEGQLGGNLQVEEEPGQIARGTGTINIVEGRYRAYGQRLDIENGRLLFTGGPLTNPGLDLRAVRISNNVTSGIKVRGRLQQPQLELFSIPAMGQTDTLSYLLLGRPMEGASGEEGAMMAQAALALGLAGGDRLARTIGDRFGLDEMRVESSDSGDQASLVVGRYLSPRLYVSYGVGLIESFNSLNLRYQISEKWQLKAVSGENQGADFLYSIER